MVALRDGAPLLGLRRGVRAGVVSMIAAGLLGTVAVTMMVTSGPSELMISAAAQGAAAKPGRATELHEWDAGRMQGLPYNLRHKEKINDMRMEVHAPRPCPFPALSSHDPPKKAFFAWHQSRAGKEAQLL